MVNKSFSFLKNLLLLILLCFCMMSCDQETSLTNKPDRFGHIKDEKAAAILKKAIAFAGGLDKWESIKHLNYTKKFDLFLESGAIEKSFEQTHDYQYSPTKITIVSKENGEETKTVFQDGIYKRTKNGKAVESTQAALKKAVNTSTYVVSAPFNLLDAGAVISYDGERTMDDGRIVDVLKVVYDAERFKNHSSSETWKYYFDKNETKLVANWVKSSDHLNLVENLTFEKANGILFNKHRKSYRIDEEGNKLYFRAEYFYDNYKVE